MIVQPNAVHCLLFSYKKETFTLIYKNLVFPTELNILIIIMFMYNLERNVSQHILDLDKMSFIISAR